MLIYCNASSNTQTITTEREYNRRGGEKYSLQKIHADWSDNMGQEIPFVSNNGYWGFCLEGRTWDFVKWFIFFHWGDYMATRMDTMVIVEPVFSPDRK